MQISTKVFPKAKQNSIEKLDSFNFKIKTTTPAENNKANLAIIGILADYFQVKKSQIFLTKGAKSNQKTFQIEK